MEDESLLSELVRLLLTMVPQQRQRTLRESDAPYQTNPNNSKLTEPSSEYELDHLLQNIPFAQS